MKQTTWLLDIDGVLNASNPAWHQKPSQFTAYANGTGYKIRYAPSLVSSIHTLITAVDNLQVVWSTTWCGLTDQFEKAWGWPELRDAFVVPQGNYVGDLKFNAAMDVLNSGNRLIWTDDTEVPREGSTDWSTLTEGHESLLIRPDTRNGLTVEDIQDIQDFLV